MLPQALERREVSAAVACLRKQLAGAAATAARLQRLAACLLAATPAELHVTAGWPGAGHESRSRVLQRLQVRTEISCERIRQAAGFRRPQPSDASGTPLRRPTILAPA